MHFTTNDIFKTLRYSLGFKNQKQSKSGNEQRQFLFKGNARNFQKEKCLKCFIASIKKPFIRTLGFIMKNANQKRNFAVH